MLPHIIEYPTYLYIMPLKLMNSMSSVIGALGSLRQNNRSWEAIHGEGYTEGGFTKMGLHSQEIYTRGDLRGLYTKGGTPEGSLCMKKVESTHKGKVTRKVMTDGDLIPIRS